MRTTLDLPDDLMRRAKAAAAMRGLKLKDLVASFIAQGLSAPETAERKGQHRPIPVRIPAAGRTVKPITGADVDELLVNDAISKEDDDRSS